MLKNVDFVNARFTEVKGEFTLMLYAAICDDNNAMLDFLNRKINEIFIENEIHCEIGMFLSGVDFLESHAQRPFDVVFLDIVMPDVDGFEIAKRLRTISHDTYIIFITTESSLVYDSFDFQPFYFIPKSKPTVTENKLRDVIKKLALHITVNEKVIIEGAYDNKKIVSPNEILYIKSSLNNVEYHFSDGTKYMVRGKLSDVLPGLNTHIFARTHNRFVVNMNHVDIVDYPNMELKLINGESIGISRGYKKEFDEAYLRFRRNFS